MNGNKKVGTKWFTFYTKVRPWLGCVSFFTLLVDVFQYPEIYFGYWWLMLYFLGGIAQVVLSIFVFAKSKDDYATFVEFVNGVLIFEIIYMPYSQAVQWYVNNSFDIGEAIVVGALMFIICYFVWYRLSIKYFRKRIGILGCASVANDVNMDNTNVNNTNVSNTNVSNTNVSNTEVVFCRKCGGKLISGSKFCSKCGTEIIVADNANNSNESKDDVVF